ncbi:hypothetical protein LX73_2293 [Fodinibius salinus]|uniref:C2H2-type domain-containing protein n=1 Tax=Fodinibius salinus TaxID=860790 RepID=A0A5D3YEZ2_9BACT|nr:hypothetical protein [Fodinibius salinus]TYP92047.1 hypothetical protein LX73_2293 [Fodinibius salinus]
MSSDKNEQCPKCDRKVSKLEENETHYMWTHSLESEGVIPRATICMIKKEDYEQQ